MSRLTFRDPVYDVAWQKQVRDRYLHEPAPPIDLDLKKSIVRPISRKTAEAIILKYEWLGTLPTDCNVFYGLFFDIYCAGCVCISVGNGAGANATAGKEFGLERHEMSYLARGANTHWSPKNANSKLVTHGARLTYKDHGAKLMIAYSDTDAGEIGTIYQACNWICIGRGVATIQWIHPTTGRVYDQKLPYNLARSRGGQRKYWVEKLYSEGWVVQRSNPKWRYVTVLDRNDKRLVDAIESMRVEYPKRANMRAADGSK